MNGKTSSRHALSGVDAGQWAQCSASLFAHLTHPHPTLGEIADHGMGTFSGGHLRNEPAEKGI